MGGSSFMGGGGVYECLELFSSVNSPSPLKEKHYDNKKFVHYTHEQRFNSFKRDLHHVYEDIFKDTPAMNAEVIVGNRNRRDAKHELIRKRPAKRLLRNQPRDRKYQ